MARKVEVVRPRALRDAIVVPLKPRRPSRGSSVALGVAMLLTVFAVGFGLGFLVAHLVRR